MTDRDETHHRLKTWPEFFARVWDGRKRCELRKDDRDFRVGDRLSLEEFDPVAGAYSGRWIAARITDIVRDAPGFGLMPGHAILSLFIVERVPGGIKADGAPGSDRP